MEDGQAIERSPLGYEFRIFPAAQHYELKPGSLVFVNLRSDKNSGLARVKPAQLPVGQVSEVEKRIAQPQVTAEPGKHRTSEENPEGASEATTKKGSVGGQQDKESEERINVEYASGGTAYSRFSRLTTVYTGHKCVVVCSDTHSFRKLCRTQVHAGDVCVDIGSSYGASTQILWEQCGRAVGLEVSKEASQAAQLRYPNVTFERMDVLAEPQRLIARVSELLEESRSSTCTSNAALDCSHAGLQPHDRAKPASPDHAGANAAPECSGQSNSGQLKVFVDIGGNRELQAVTSVLPALQRLGVPWIFVKSQAMIKSALHHLRGLDAAETGILTPASGLPVPVLQSQLPEQSASVRNTTGSCKTDNPASTAIDSAAPVAQKVDASKDSQTEHAGATTEASGRTRKRLKRKLLPEKVLWRFSNQNMPRVFDLDSRQTCSVHHTEARPSATPPGDQLHSPCFTREGLAVIRECSDWWNKLVHQEKPRKYPLDYPARHTSDGVNICRFHNYSTCLKRLSGDCPFDHSHCHACGAAGHVASVCDVCSPC